MAQQWPGQWSGWPVEGAGAACPPHDDRVQCLLALTRRELTAARTDPVTLRQLVMAVEADPDTTPEEVWALRDAGRDCYTPALDAVSRLLPPRTPADRPCTPGWWPGDWPLLTMFTELPHRWA